MDNNNNYGIIEEGSFPGFLKNDSDVLNQNQERVNFNRKDEYKYIPQIQLNQYKLKKVEEKINNQQIDQQKQENKIKIIIPARDLPKEKKNEKKNYSIQDSSKKKICSLKKKICSEDFYEKKYQENPNIQNLNTLVNNNLINKKISNNAKKLLNKFNEKIKGIGELNEDDTESDNESKKTNKRASLLLEEIKKQDFKKMKSNF